jgi:hypothetical protein
VDAGDTVADARGNAQVSERYRNRPCAEGKARRSCRTNWVRANARSRRPTGRGSSTELWVRGRAP